MAKEIQQSIFLENAVGKLANLCSELKAAQVNVKAISVVDSGDFGVVRMLTDNPEKTSDILKERRLSFLESQVITSLLPDKPGALADAARELAEAGVNIQYVYGSAAGEGRALVVFRVSAPSLAEEILSRISS
ncbi:MAG: ACT domain-containing protein [Armatimonadota bacterium]|nr:ACT domain-containing protein [Armatimonadota bacterium]